jgi:hypothetical protein
MPRGYAVLSYTAEAYAINSGGIAYLIPLHQGPHPPNTHSTTGANATKAIRLYVSDIKTYEIKTA